LTDICLTNSRTVTLK